MTKILIADDHEIVRNGLRSIIADIPDMEVTGEACNAEELLRKVRENCYDVIVLDISLPDARWLDIMEGLKRENSRIPVLILSTYPEEQYAVRAYRVGAAGYFKKEEASNELAGAIRTVSGGGRYFDSSLVRSMAGDSNE